MFEEINFIPLHILTKHYPLAINEEKQAYYSNFHISYANEKLLDFSKNLQIEKDKPISIIDSSIYKSVSNYLFKTEAVIKQLNVQLVYNVEGEKNREGIKTIFIDKKECDCYKCSYNNFNFFNAFISINKIETDLNGKLKQAYYNYKLGNYRKAKLTYEEIKAEAWEKHNYTTYFIAQYNLRHLSSFLGNFWYNETVDEKEINELKQIDLLEEAFKLKGCTNYDLLTFIAQEDYFNDSYQKVQDISSKIIDHYHSQLYGGWSSNQHVSQLICEFAQLDSFLNGNYIVFDFYSNFEKLFEIFLESLIASHAIGESQDSRLLFFNDYLTNKIVLYGHRKSLLKYCSRYNVQDPKY